MHDARRRLRGGEAVLYNGIIDAYADADRKNLAQRTLHPMGRGDHSRPVARGELRHLRVRGHPLLLHTLRTPPYSACASTCAACWTRPRSTAWTTSASAPMNWPRPCWNWCASTAWRPATSARSCCAATARWASTGSRTRWRSSSPAGHGGNTWARKRWLRAWTCACPAGAAWPPTRSRRWPKPERTT